MADITVDDVRTRFPELSAAQYADVAVAQAIHTAQQIAAATSEIWLHCAAHILVLERQAMPDGGRGEVALDRLGPRQNQYMTMAEQGRDVFFTTTAYGRTAWMLEKRSPRAQFSVMVA